MGSGSKKISAVCAVIGLIAVLLGSSPASPAAASPAPEPAPTTAVTLESKPAPVAEQASAADVEAAPAPAPAPEPVRKLRRLKGRELNVAIAKQARTIINEHYKKPFGTEIAFESNGKQYACVIEQHYHPPGGELKPWGPHAGCSLFAVETVAE